MSPTGPDGSAALAPQEASEAVQGLGWRHLVDGLTTAVPVSSLLDASDVVRAAAGAVGPGADGHLRLRATAERVELVLQPRGQRAVTGLDVELARAVTAAVRAAGHETVVRPAGRPVQALEVAVDALDVPAVRPSWRAVLGYDDVDEPSSGTDLADPFEGGPPLWFQQVDAPRPERSTMHLDVTVPHNEAVARVGAALAAGGRLVSDDRAPAFWVLADREGDEVCVCTWQGRG